jgi:hypothetical protein
MEGIISCFGRAVCDCFTLRALPGAHCAVKI